MKLSISNIGWDVDNDDRMYLTLEELGFTGLEIAPTRIFSHNPYDQLEKAKNLRANLKSNYGLSISSMQSIWYGRQENIFQSNEEREALINYTKDAIDFAVTLGCGNLVFGCPKNRNMNSTNSIGEAVDFFKKIGDFAFSKGTIIGMEANPTIYNTNFINDTVSALELIEMVDSKGFKLNLDLGTVIQNDEDISEIEGKVGVINHVHISEPWLKPIKNRLLHKQLRDILEKEDYKGYISIEMGKVDDISLIKEKMKYVGEIFL